ncbi:MFS transporter [Paracoccus aminovorans]|uniref:MFS transporter n=1 Tax=Paracoccus aminovorans TaxID=34004 RepID=UPI000784F7B9|nr:MFS transporter [Paracoccus aminovorans]MDQ7778008.1 MFS transporter [Paracoccus aminovorans]
MPPSPRQTRLMLLACFLAAGIGAGVWGANLPALGRRTGMDEAQIGLVLLCFAAGAIASMNLVPRLMARFGAGRVSCLAAGLFGAGIAAVALVGQMGQAALVAGFCGVVFGALDVAMNSHAAQFEARAGRPVMSFFHAMFSAGTLAGAAGYAWRAHAGGAAPASLVAAGVLILLLAALAATCAGGAPAPRDDATPAQARGGTGAPGLRVLALGAVAFAIFFAEGAIMDWAALYLVRILGASESTGALGYAVFAGSMLLGRLLGDPANRIFGAVRLFRLGTATVALALAAMLVAGAVAPVLAALALCGLGMANVIPILFSAAGRLGLADGGRSMSRVLTMGYAGLLVGPAIMGFIAKAASLQVSLALVALAVAATCFCARLVRPEAD